MVHFHGCFSLLSIAVFNTKTKSSLGRKGLRTPSRREVEAGTQVEPISQENSPQTCLRANLGEAFFFSVEVSFSQIPLVCVKFTQTNQINKPASQLRGTVYGVLRLFVLYRSPVSDVWLANTP